MRDEGLVGCGRIASSNSLGDFYAMIMAYGMEDLEYDSIQVNILV